MSVPRGGGPRLVPVIKRFEQRHPGCKVLVIDTGFDRDQLGWLRSGELGLLVMRLPVHGSDVTIGPCLTRERRVPRPDRPHRVRSLRSGP